MKLLFLLIFLSQIAHSSSKNKILTTDLFINLAKKVNPCVVNISSLKEISSYNYYPNPFMDPLFDFFFKPQRPQKKEKIPQSLGTGFVVRKDGLIITNNHVVEQADEILVSFKEDKKNYKAKVIGKDKRTDIALLKLKRKNLSVCLLGSSKNLKIGQWVSAIGNPFGYSHTMTKGIISGLGRKIDELNRFAFIQTDTPINPGNSGGPLVNLKGEVIGVNTAIKAYAQGIGFAIPIDNVKSILKSLETYGYLKTGYIGVIMHAYPLSFQARQSLSLMNQSGVLLEEVIKNSPAFKAGLQKYDFLTKIDGKKLNHSRDLIRIVSDLPIGKKVSVSFMRNGKKRKTQIRISQKPKEILSSQLSPQKRKFRKKSLRAKGSFAPYSYAFKVADDKKLKKAVITYVRKGSYSYFAGLKKGDIILEINKKPVFSRKQLFKQMTKNSNLFTLLRNKQKIMIYLERN